MAQEIIVSTAQTLFRATIIAGIISAILITGTYLPPFPPQFQEFLTKALTIAFHFDYLLPVKLAFTLWAINLLIDFGISVVWWLAWIKAWLFGRPAPQSLV